LDCPKCLNTFPAAGNIDRGTWCYKTVGPFSVANYADGAYGVLLTLDFFSEHRMHSLHTTPVLSFSATAPNKKELEADLALFWQETRFGRKIDGLLFAECKTYGRFEKKDFDRMKYLAATFPGAVLVFGTLRKSLNSKEISAISRIAKKGRKYWKAERPINPVLILTGTELIDSDGRPYCWEELLQKKFDHLDGLIDICDATQQIYLNLPPWHEDWNKRWEARRKRRAAKKAR
jgi:hypothetical protein